MSQPTNVPYHFSPDPQFKEGEPVNFTVDGSEKRYNGKIRGIAWHDVFTGYIIEVDIVDMDIPVRDDKGNRAHLLERAYAIARCPSFRMGHI